MRFVTFTHTSQKPRVGVLVGGAVIDISSAAPLVFEHAFAPRWELIDVLRGEPEGMGLDGAAEIAAAVLDQLGILDVGGLGETNDLIRDITSGPLAIGGIEMLLPLDEVRLHAPLPLPGSLRLFPAFELHAEATARAAGQYLPPEWYEQPTFSFGSTQAVVGPDVSIHMPNTQALDFEVGLACVVGRSGRDIAEEEAEYYIAGYTILNSWVARDTERQLMPLGGQAKARDFATALGPALVTPEELDDMALPDGRFNLPFAVRVNGTVQARGNMRDVAFTFPQLLAYASRDTTLYPGDVICAGGAGSLLVATQGAGPWVEFDDDVEIEVAGLGSLRNRIG